MKLRKRSGGIELYDSTWLNLSVKRLGHGSVQLKMTVFHPFLYIATL